MCTARHLGLLLLTLEAKVMKCSPSGSTALTAAWQITHWLLKCHLEMTCIMSTNTELAKAQKSHDTQFHGARKVEFYQHLGREQKIWRKKTSHSHSGGHLMSDLVGTVRILVLFWRTGSYWRVLQRRNMTLHFKGITLVALLRLEQKSKSVSREAS